MAYVKPKYEGEDFLEWYKTHYGKDYDGSALNRGEGMLDQDWEIGSALYGKYQQYNNDKALLEKGYSDAQSVADNTYNTQKESLVGDYNKNQAELLKNYQSSVSGLDKSKNQSLQSASITYDKLKKYLPTQIKAQGLGGLGVSESTMLQAHNNYATQTGSIKNNYNENKTALEEAYGSNKANLDTTHESNISSLDSQKLEADTERKTTLDQSLAELLRNYRSGAETDVKDITKKFFDANEELQEKNYNDYADIIRKNTTFTNAEDLTTEIDALDINQDQKDWLKLLAADQAGKNIEANKTAKYENYKTNMPNITTESKLQEVYQEIDALDINQDQKDDLKDIAEKQFDDYTTIQRDNFKIELETDFTGAIREGGVSTSAEVTALLNSLESNKDLFDTDSYNRWKSQLETLRNKFSESEAETEQAETDKRVLEGKEYVKYNGKDYKILSKLAQDSNEIKNNNSFTKQLNDLGFTNPYDKNIPNGTTFYINRDARGQDSSTFWDWVPIVHIWTVSNTSAHNWHVTYYNGEWYHSEEQ